jgi:hypothetical protein
VAYTVTATQATHPSPYGMFFQLLVLVNAAMAATPAVNKSTTAYNTSVTTTMTGSYVFGVAETGENDTALTLESNCSTYSPFADSTNGNWYGCFQTTAATGTPGPTTVGYSTAFSNSVGCVAAEVLASGGSLSVDATTPAVATSSTASALTTASFTPPGSSLLMAIVATNGNSSAQETLAISDNSSGALSWSANWELLSGDINGYYYAMGIWTAQVPSGGTNTSPAWAASYDIVSGGSGSWVNPGNALTGGGSSGPWATWTAP